VQGIQWLEKAFNWTERSGSCNGYILIDMQM
jgi:hypothetical protein